MRKMKRFADGGNTGRGQARYDRMVKDIESDYEKAKARKTGRAAEVAKAKYDQRMADAKDDLAKARGEDRTATRAAEKAAERNLKLTRRFGSAEPKFEDKPLVTPKGPSEAEMSKITSDASQKFKDSGSFKAAFAAARKDPNKPKTFTWRGASYTTELASEKPKAAARSTGSGRGTATTAGRGTPSTAGRGATTTAGRGTATTAGRGTPPASGGGNKPVVAAGYTPTLAEKRAAELRAMVAANRKQAANTKDYSGSAIAARLGERLGFNTSRENTARSLEQQAQRSRWREVEAEGQKNAEDYAKAKKRAERIAAGNKPNATPTEKFYAKNPDAMKKGGAVKGYAKGGKIDGCAVRGKTKAGRK